MANLIVAEIASLRGVPLTFREYLRAGVPITVASLVMGAAWMSLVR